MPDGGFLVPDGFAVEFLFCATYGGLPPWWRFLARWRYLRSRKRFLDSFAARRLQRHKENVIRALDTFPSRKDAVVK